MPPTLVTPQFGGVEWFEDITVPAPAGVLTPTVLEPQKELRKNKTIWGLFVEAQFHARIVGVAGFAGVSNAEAPLGFIDRVHVEGTRLGQARTPLDASGDTLFRYVNHFFPNSPQYCLVGLNGADFVDLMASPTSTFPMTSPTAGAATTDYDVIVGYLIPLVPLGIPLVQQRGFMYRGDEWSILKLQLTIGDQSSLFDVKANGTFTFGAVKDPPAAAAPTGNPLLRVHMVRVNLGSERFKVKPALCVRTFQTLSTILQTSNFTDQLIARLTVKEQRYLRALVKTGLKPTDTPTPGVQSVIQSLSDRIITRPLVRRSGELIRNPKTTRSHKAWQNFAHGSKAPVGYNLIDFIEGGDVNTFIKTAGLTKDDFELDGDVVSAATQIGEILEERSEGDIIVAS